MARIGKLNAQEWVELKKAQSISFIYGIDVEALQQQASETPEQIENDWCWGAFDDSGKLMSGMVNWPLQIHYDGHIVGMGGIGGVISLPEGRMQGNVKNIFRAIFKEAKQNGELFSVLFPFSQTFYRQFGYEVCHEGRTYQFPTKELSNYKQTGTARMHHPDEPDNALRAIYEQFANRYNYAVARNDIAWKRILKGNPYRSEAYHYILSRDGQDVAYCLIAPVKAKDFGNDMHVFDFAYVDREALFDLLGFLYRLWPQFRHVRIEPQSDLLLNTILAEPNCLEITRLCHTMARIVDVPKALSLLRHPSGHGTYRIAVQDDFLPENTGVYEVHYQDQAVQVMPLEFTQPCDLSVSIQTFTQLCVGYLSLQMALFKPDAQLFGSKSILEQVFIEKPRFFTDRF